MKYCPNVIEIFRAMSKKKYKIFSDKRGYDLNLIGIRTNDNRSNKFNDWLSVIYYYDGMWNQFNFPCTTDPGTYYRENPMNVSGTGIIKPNQYLGLFKLGTHKGYKALQQNKPVTLIRDNNKDDVLDFDCKKEENGMFNINLHKSNKFYTSLFVDRWSGGCVVIQNADHFDFLLTLAQNSVNIYGNSISFTLLEEKDF